MCYVQMMIESLLVPMIVLGYAIGALPIARILSHAWAGIDIREFGTGNPGAANVYRNVGLAPAALVAIVNLLQGLGPVLLARAVGLDEMGAVLVGLAAMAGYGWPVTQRFRGGRGVAVTIGVMSAFAAGPAAVLICIFLACIPMRKTSIATFVGFLTLPLYLTWTGSPSHVVALSLLALAYIVTRRLWGIWGYAEGSDGMTGRILRRVVLDYSPGQRLVGPRVERAGDRVGRDSV